MAVKKSFDELNKKRIESIDFVANQLVMLEDDKQLERKRLQSRLYSEMYELFKKTKRYRSNTFYHNDEAFVGTMFYQLENWNPEMGSFTYCTLKLLKLRLDTVRENEKDSYEKGYQRDHMNEEADRPVRAEMFDDVPEHRILSEIREWVDEGMSQPGESLMAVEQMKTMLKVVSDGVKAKQKEYENRKTICYPTLFYTELMTRLLSNRQNPQSRTDTGIPEETVRGCVTDQMLSYIDRGFAESYLDGTADSAEHIHMALLKRLSDFTGEEKDQTEVCGYDLRNIVYMKYIEKLKGKPVKDAAISQQRTKFETMLSLLYRQQE